MQLQRYLPRCWLFSLCVLVPLSMNSTSIQACGIDGIPSMSMNGTLVTRIFGQATKENLSYYAPFSLGKATVGKELHFAEDIPKLQTALTAKAFAVPFQWTFGDGTTARGLSVSHRYSQPGWYRVSVHYYYPPQQHWLVFDSAELYIPGVAAQQTAALPSQLSWSVGSAVLGLGALLVFLLRRQSTRSLRSGSKQRPLRR